MERTCQFNIGVICDSAECYHCGWDPEVAKERLVKVPHEKQYKIPFTGYCEVWAKSPEEAAKMAEDIEKHFFARYDFGDPECLEEEEENEG